MNKLKIAVLGSTRGTDMQPIIDAIKTGELNAQIICVGSDKQDAFILERAKMNGIETVYVDYKKFRTREEAESIFAEKFREKNTELVLLIGFMKIISPYFLNSFRKRIWNIHPSLLPKYSGAMNMNVHEAVLANKEKETGCTLHEVIEKIDAGKIIIQKKIVVEKNDTPQTLKEKIQKLEQECLLQALKSVTEGKIIIGGQFEN